MNKEWMLSVTVASLLATFLVGCTPRVEVAVPEKPITINLNVKVEHEIKVKIDKELDEIFSEDSELF
ncbi:YnbE family lipoprotein [Zooshikella harenae]